MLSKDGWCKLADVRRISSSSLKRIPGCTNSIPHVEPLVVVGQRAVVHQSSNDKLAYHAAYLHRSLKLLEFLHVVLPQEQQHITTCKDRQLS